jgi:hypothetical protein
VSHGLSHGLSSLVGRVSCARFHTGDTPAYVWRTTRCTCDADDDFYIDATAAAGSLDHSLVLESQSAAGAAAADIDIPPAQTHVAAGATWRHVGTSLRRGVQLAHAVRRTLQQRLSMTLSVGVASNKLLARCAGGMARVVRAYRRMPWWLFRMSTLASHRIIAPSCTYMTWA